MKAFTQVVAASCLVGLCAAAANPIPGKYRKDFKRFRESLDDLTLRIAALEAIQTNLGTLTAQVGTITSTESATASAIAAFPA